MTGIFLKDLLQHSININSQSSSYITSSEWKKQQYVEYSALHETITEVRDNFDKTNYELFFLKK